MGLLLHGHDADLWHYAVGVVERGLAQVDDRTTVAQVGAHHGLVDEAVPDEVRVAGPHRYLLRHAAPEGGPVHVASVLIEPAHERGVGGADAQQAAAGLALRRTDQLVDQLVLGGHGADEVMRAQEHVGPVVPLDLLLEAVDERRVDVLRGDRPGDEPPP
ncbi:hypothetical protein [Streptomyces sp. ISL-10]|uniref:hypothetical protein n=1 Tax=Streptomyces sp. ISL-10 TaxID=2819172 RepID=UPI0027E51035|nr:hypothetical protein [Streptomyces sp. ISL-10]